MPSPVLSPLAGALRLGIVMATSLPDLAAFWRDSQPALKRVAPEELAHLVAEKDRRKGTLPQS